MGLPGAMSFTNRSEELERAISGTPAEGMTALYDAVFQARARLQSGARDKKVPIGVSDGGDNATVHNERIARDIRRQYTIRICLQQPGAAGCLSGHSSVGPAGGEDEALRTHPLRLHRRWGIKAAGQNRGRRSESKPLRPLLRFGAKYAH
jgi:hypothetical protein